MKHRPLLMNLSEKISPSIYVCMYVCMYIRLKQLTNRNIDNTQTILRTLFYLRKIDIFCDSWCCMFCYLKINRLDF